MTLKPHVTWDLELHKAEKTWRFVIVQVHAQQYNVTLSLRPDFPYDETDTGQDVAVLYPIKYYLYEDHHFYLKSENSDQTFQVDIIAVPYISGGELLVFVYSLHVIYYA